jgi:hypothetical protein
MDEGQPLPLATPLPRNLRRKRPETTDREGVVPADDRQIIIPRDMTAAPTDNQNRQGTGMQGPVCPFCFSGDTMEPFRRSSRVALLSRILPRLRWRYCRSCTRHFLSFIPSRRRS